MSKNLSSLKRGYLTVIIGPMFSGKTTKLFSYIDVFKKIGLKTFYLRANFNHHDVIISRKIFTNHDKKKMKGLHIDGRGFTEIIDYIKKEKVQKVVIDEVNFLPKRQARQIIDFLLAEGIDLILSGLAYDYRKREFGITLEYFKKADEAIELFAVCQKCGKRADHSQRISGGIEQIEAVEEKTEYMAVCSRCHQVYGR